MIDVDVDVDVDVGVGVGVEVEVEVDVDELVADNIRMEVENYRSTPLLAAARKLGRQLLRTEAPGQSGEQDSVADFVREPVGSGIVQTAAQQAFVRRGWGPSFLTECNVECGSDRRLGLK